MAIAFGSISSTTTATGLTIVGAKPSGTVDGDLLIAFIGTVATGGSASVVTPPAGWTQISTEQTGPGTGGFWGYIAAYKKIAASEGSNYTFAISKTADGTRHLIIARYTGANGTVNQVSNRTDNPASTTRTADSVTTTVNNCMLLYLGWDWLDANATETPPTGMTERYDAGNQQLYWADELQNTAGSTGTRSNTCQSNSGSPRGAYLVALEPASTGITGTLDQTIDPVTLSAAGNLPIKGQVSASVGEVSLAASASLPIQGSLSQTIGPVGLAATGTISLPPINGALSAGIGEVTLSAQGGNTQRTPGGGYYRPVIYLDDKGRAVDLKAYKARTENQAIQAAKNAVKELPKEDRPEARQAVRALQEAIEDQAAEQVIERSRQVAATVGELKGLLHQLEEIARQEAEDDEEAAMLLLGS